MSKKGNVPKKGKAHPPSISFLTIDNQANQRTNRFKGQMNVQTKTLLIGLFETIIFFYIHLKNKITKPILTKSPTSDVF